jgi:dTMP kinase
MVASLQAGQHLVVDRYAYSGIAFTSSKVGVSGLGLDWTTSPDRGLLAPDLVIFLDITSTDAAARGSFGEERYEKKEIQDRVREVFTKLRLQANQETTPPADRASGASFGAGVAWRVVNAGQTKEQVHAEILALAKQAIATSANAPVRYL